VVPSCAEAGVLGVLPGVIGSIQATETIKILLGAGDTLVGRLLLYDAMEMRFREMRCARTRTARSAARTRASASSRTMTRSAAWRRTRPIRTR
jgi:hypothetical protein